MSNSMNTNVLPNFLRPIGGKLEKIPTFLGVMQKHHISKVRNMIFINFNFTQLDYQNHYLKTYKVSAHLQDVTNALCNKEVVKKSITISICSGVEMTEMKIFSGDWK